MGDIYTCDFCGFSEDWDEHDEIHGHMWGCEKCGATFCSKCLEDAVGKDGYLKVMHGLWSKDGSDLILCPNCAEKEGY